MARGRLVWIDPTVGTVGSSSHTGSPVALCVLNDERINVQALGVCVGFSVLQQRRDEFARLDWPSTLDSAELLGLRVTSNVTLVSSVWNDFLLCHNILEVCQSTTEVHATDGANYFPGVLLKVFLKIGRGVERGGMGRSKNGMDVKQSGRGNMQGDND